MKVLFVCLGNICRSPAAEGIFRKLIQNEELHTKVFHDSCGTGGWHEGEPPDGRMTAHARERGYDLSDFRARPFDPSKDFENFDLILTMDGSNFSNVKRMAKSEDDLNKVRPFTSFCKIHDVTEVPDPYYKDELGFELVMDILEDGCEQLILHIKERLP
ncbi:MAG TPA: phosphotyrosine protein phosphatase [Bdellovibrionales bacterium]|nr:phosphotyrosine protein phosphatase [Pseudobdellovibrionaceae bacterium]HAG90699.1 phosphotyrosine protein phosphatase [Bdellovibrionales bacterium]|tara:strand:- start:5944 stop:6420 length:477 start_codon:yes stop_codon:yes gene_type:complete